MAEPWARQPPFDTAITLRAGFSAPLHDRVRVRLVADGINEVTAVSAADGAAWCIRSVLARSDIHDAEPN